MDVSAAQLITSTVASALGGGGLAQVLNFMTKRQQARTYAMGAVDHAVETALKGVTAELGRVYERLETIETNHEQCETDLAESKRAADRLQRQIDALMDGKPADYASIVRVT